MWNETFYINVIVGLTDYYLYLSKWCGYFFHYWLCVDLSHNKGTLGAVNSETVAWETYII